MNWKTRYEWRKLSVDEIKPGMKARLIKKDAHPDTDFWTNHIKIGDIFTVLDRKYDTPESSIRMDTRHIKSKHSTACCEDHTYFEYRG